MNITKKILTIILSSILLTSFLVPVSAFAEELIPVSISQTQAHAGETVDVFVSIGANSNMGNCRFDIYFDETRLEYISFQEQPICEDTLTAVVESTGKVALGIVKSTSLTDGGNLVSLKFKISEGTACGEIPLDIIVIEFVNGDTELNIPFQLNNGLITVVENPNGDLGNVDGKDGINIADAMITFRYVAGKTELTEAELKRANVSGGESVTIEDAMQIFRYVAGKITTFNPK